MDEQEVTTATVCAAGSRVWRSWPVVALTAAIFAVMGVHLTAGWFTWETPNYSRVEDGLYLGGYVQKPPRDTKAVLNLCETKDPYQVEVHRWEPIRDAVPAPSLDWLRKQVGFVEAQRKAGRTVFVHCRNGASRSGMVVAAYLMARNGWSRDETLKFLRSKRDVVRPNPAFMPLLQEWEQSLKGEP